MHVSTLQASITRLEGVCEALNIKGESKKRSKMTQHRHSTANTTGESKTTSKKEKKNRRHRLDSHHHRLPVVVATAHRDGGTAVLSGRASPSTLVRVFSLICGCSVPSGFCSIKACNFQPWRLPNSIHTPFTIIF